MLKSDKILMKVVELQWFSKHKILINKEDRESNMSNFERKKVRRRNLARLHQNSFIVTQIRDGKSVVRKVLCLPVND